MRGEPGTYDGVVAALVIGAVIMGLVVAVAFRVAPTTTDTQWLLVGAFVVGNLVLVMSTGPAVGAIGILLMAGSVIALVLVRLRRRGARR